MDFDEYEYLEQTVDNLESQKGKKSVNGDEEPAKSEEKDKNHRHSSKHRSNGKDDEDDARRSKRSKSEDSSRDVDRHKDRDSSRHRSLSRDHAKERDVDEKRSRDGERDRHRSGHERRDRDTDEGKRRDRTRDRDHDRLNKERSRRSRSRSERRRSDLDEIERERIRDLELREREREKEFRERDRESRRKKEEAVPVVDPERDQRTVFAYQITLKADERDVYEFFSRAGKVRDVRLIMDRNSRRSKGVGYIEFYDAMSVPMAIALSGQPLLGQPVMVKPSEAEKNLVQSTASAGASGLTNPYSGGARRLYVGNLHTNITEDQLRQVFEAFGTVELVQLPLDEAGHCKGFGFVQFARLEDARNALNLNGQLELAGRMIKVSTVTDQPGVQEVATNTGDLDDDEGGGLSLNAHSRALLMQKLDRSGFASSMTGLLVAPAAGPSLAAAPILGAAPLVSPFVAPIVQGLIPALTGLPGTALPLSMVPASYAESIGNPSQFLLLKNMFDPKAETEPDFELDIKEDVEEECSKYGHLMHAFVDKNSAGFVYVKFDNAQSAINAQRALHGRWFAGKMITATFMTLQAYEAKFPESA